MEKERMKGLRGKCEERSTVEEDDQRERGKEQDVEQKQVDGEETKRLEERTEKLKLHTK